MPFVVVVVVVVVGRKILFSIKRLHFNFLKSEALPNKKGVSGGKKLIFQAELNSYTLSILHLAKL